MEISGGADGFVVAMLASRVDVTRLLLRSAGVWPEQAEWEPVLIVGPDDLEDVPEFEGAGVWRFQGVPVWRVEHWPGDPVLAVPAGQSVADAYHVVRRVEQCGVDAGKLRAFGPPGWEHVSIPLARGPRQHRIDFVPVRKVVGPMIGVELT